MSLTRHPDCEEQASLLEEAPVQKSRLGKSVVLAVSSISACAFVAGWARSGAVSQLAIDGIMSKSQECTTDGESCADSKCCTNPGSTCWKKNDYWSSCNATCNPYNKWEDGQWVHKDYKVWDCQAESQPTCTADGQDCSQGKCCSQWGSTCYKKNDGWASCNATCNPYYKWENNQWVHKDYKVWDCKALSNPPCTHDGQSCESSKCCISPGSTCYKKNEYWASCNQSCTQNWKWENNHWVEKPADEKIWDCTVLSDGESPKHPGEDVTCEAEAETKCAGCEEKEEKEGAQGQCKECRWDHRIECCKKNDGGKSTETCCAEEGVPSSHTGCGGSGYDHFCDLEADTKCSGCQGAQCLSCKHGEKVVCCANRKCEEECTGIEPFENNLEGTDVVGNNVNQTCMVDCTQDSAKDADKVKACCAEQGISSSSTQCTV